MTPRHEAEVRGKWKELCDNMLDFERHLLKLVAHPDTPPEMLTEARATYQRILTSMTDPALQLQERYPQKRWFAQPWQFESLNGYVYRVREKKE